MYACVSRVGAGGREAVNSCALTLATCLLASPVYFISQSVNRKTLRRPAWSSVPRLPSAYVSRYSGVLVATATRHAASVPAKLMALSLGTHRDRRFRGDGTDERTLKNPGSGPGDVFVSMADPPWTSDFLERVSAAPGILESLPRLSRANTPEYTGIFE